MADCVLSDGREITFDLSKLTITEFRALVGFEQKPEEEDEVMARVSGLDLEEYRSLSYLDWRVLTTSFFTAARNPLKNPN